MHDTDDRHQASTPRNPTLDRGRGQDREPWEDPTFEVLAPDRIEVNPGFGSDGGFGDCQHV